MKSESNAKLYCLTVDVHLVGFTCMSLSSTSRESFNKEAIDS